MDCNAAFAEKVLGTRCENIVGQSIYDLPDIIPQALSNICSENDKNLLNNNGLQTYETAITCADGVKRDFLLSRSTFTDHNGTIAGILSVMQDLTDKNRAEKLLRDRTAELLKSDAELKRQIKKRKKAKRTVKKAHREIEHLISSLPTILIGLSRENQIIHWNTVAEKVLETPAADVMAPDGSEVRLLCQLAGGSMAHFTLPPGQVSKAIRHRTVEELWFFISGQGRMWRAGETVDVSPGVSISIPVGTPFQFRTDGDQPLAAVAVTMPPWPGEDEAEFVDGAWAATV